MLNSKISYLFSFFRAGFFSKTFKKMGKNCFIRNGNIIIGNNFITFGSNVSLGRNGTLSAWKKYNLIKYQPEIIIQDDTSIGDEFHITCINKIRVGKSVLMGKKVTITDNSHGINTINERNISPIRRDLFTKGAVIIGDNVWIGDKATILPGVTIGNGSIVAANSVVSKDIPEFVVAAGIPAKVIKNI